MRLKAALAVLLVAGCGGSARDGTELLPDLVQSPPSALEVYRDGRTWRLGFLSAVENVAQIVRRSDGSTSTHHMDGEIRFVQSATHRHWHLLDFERYDILTAAGKTVGRDQKTGFCLGDRYNASRSVRLPGEPEQPVWTQECGRGQPKRLIVREGISPGYGDDYVPRLEGQSIDITGLPAGSYILRHRVNVERVLRESDYGNNSAETPFELTWSDSGTPTLRAVYDG
jgi:hypothetical protein